MFRKFSLLTVMLLAAAYLVGCENSHRPDAAGTHKPDPTSMSAPPSIPPTPSPTPSPTPEPTPIVTHLSLAAVGDVLIHNTVYQDAATSNGGYDFTPMFEQVKPLLEQPDLVMANQESIIGGKELGLSSYPMFNSPQELGDALKAVGIDLITNANNHVLDKGEKGILSADAYWDKLGIPYTGSFVSQDDRDKIRTIEKNGIKLAFLAYTYGTNGIPVPAGKSYLVNLIDEEAMKRDIEKARSQADVVVVSPHWGIENLTTPNEKQSSLAQKLADWGADIIIGTHPHVLQPIEWLTGSTGRRTLVMYSLGNLLSAQDQPLELIGGIGGVEIVKTVMSGQSSIELRNPTFTPTYNRYEYFSNYRIEPWGQLSNSDYDKMNRYWQPVKERMKERMPELLIKDDRPNASVAPGDGK